MQVVVAAAHGHRNPEVWAVSVVAEQVMFLVLVEQVHPEQLMKQHVLGE
jgi:hypothetical protein